MSKREIPLLLKDILESAEKIKKYTAGMNFQAFLHDEKTMDATVRNFEIIGEAANRINEDFRKEHKNIDRRRIRGFRNRIVHDYFGIDYEIVWTIIEDDLDALIFNLEKILTI